jgi:AcrR family transcriptional regulator
VAADGLDALTVRAVAARLGSSPMALYRYVADRDELVAHVVDHTLAAVVLPPHPDRPEDRASWLREMAARTRRALLDHPGVAEHLYVLGPSGPHGMRFMDRVCRVLMDTGRDPAQTASAYTWLMVTVAAFAARETQGRRIARAAELDPATLHELFTRRVAPYTTDLPHLAQVAGAFSTDPEHTFRESIDHIVALLTDA